MKQALLLTTALLVGCATGPSYDEHVRAKYVGQPISFAIAQNGTPETVLNLPDGWKTYEWRWYATTVNTRTTSSTTMRGTAVTYPTCITGLFVDSRGVITDFYWKGQCRVQKD